MKKLPLISLVLVIALGACMPRNVDKIRDFATKFAAAANAADTDSVRLLYPSFPIDVKPDTLSVANMTIEQTSDSLFNIVFSPRQSLTVKFAGDDKIIVTDSRGIAVFGADDIELLKKEGKWNAGLSDVKIALAISEVRKKREKPTSPDLKFFNVHGPVQTLKITTYRNDLDYFRGTRAGTYEFDSEGNWTNYGVFGITRVRKDANGCIQALVVVDEDYDMTTICNYYWENGVPVSYGYLPKGDFVQDKGTFEYDKDGVIVAEKGEYERNFNVPYEIIYLNFKTDDRGNWIECDYRSTITDAYTGRYKSENKAGKIQREITYFEEPVQQ